jgi:glucose/arabinose dehydrogenase
LATTTAAPAPKTAPSWSVRCLRVDRDGKAAAGNNPPAGFDKRIFTYGHRNPQGITFRGNDVYISENGPWHSDEVTKLVNGGNGGWDPRGEVNGRPLVQMATAVTLPTKWVPCLRKSVQHSCL